ncbi:MAG: Maf-like protein YhdE [Gammaproteobacteria bacterium]|nr:Maf-like protein YhdE [Gammaproteobacteria bacterium]
MKPLKRSEIKRYRQTGEPVDKAGGYEIQGFGSGFAARLEGSYSGVVGLPMFEARELLATAGINWL